jgi:HK97 family phage portal protein
LIDFIKKINPFKSAENATLKEAEWWRQQMFAASASSGVAINESNAMRISAVYACVRVIAETVAGLPVSVYKKTPDGRELVEHPLNRLLGVQPNNINTGFELHEFKVTSLSLYGDAYSQKVLTNAGRIGELIPLQPQYMSVDVGPSGKLVFDYQAPGESRTFQNDQIWRCMGMSRDGVNGLSPIALARENLGIAAAAELSAATMYANGINADLAFKYPAQMPEEIFQRVKEQLADHHAGAKNNKKPLLLEGDMDVKTLNISAQDAQFLESRKFQIAEIARMFRVPMHKLNELEGATFSNIEHQSIEFVTDTILPTVKRLETSIARDLLTRREQDQGYFVRYNLDGLLRGDFKARTESYDKAITNGWMSRNEVRKKENLNPVEGLDDYLVPLNMGNGPDNAENSATVLNYLAKREVRDTRKDKNPTEWAEKFYTKHAELLVEDFGVTQDNAVAYATKRIKQILAGETLDIGQVKTDLGQIL